MNTPVLLLRALKGTCALNCLAALHLAGPLPVTSQTIMDLTGYDDGAVRKGLRALLALGLATCAGDERHTAWQLAPSAGQLPLPLGPLLPSPEKRDSSPSQEESDTPTSDSLTPIESSVKLNDQLYNNRPEFCPEPDSAAPPATPATAAPPVTVLDPTAPESFESPAPAHLRGSSLSGEQVLRRHLYRVFDASNIFLQLRRPLADALLLDDGPGWLRHSLGWLCYAERSLPNVRRGAVVYISLRDRLPCDPAYLPPPDLPFDAALDWALRGGQPEPAPEPDGVPDDPIPDPAPVVSDAPQAALWQSALERLGRELPPGLVEARLRPLRIVALDDEHCVLAAATPQARDWLALRLAGVVARALRDLTNQTILVKFRSDS